jgi:MinD-like ATPase involved in chromosome partitioning or flagellar assembly
LLNNVVNNKNKKIDIAKNIIWFVKDFLIDLSLLNSSPASTMNGVWDEVSRIVEQKKAIIMLREKLPNPAGERKFARIKGSINTRPSPTNLNETNDMNVLDRFNSVLNLAIIVNPH